MENKEWKRKEKEVFDGTIKDLKVKINKRYEKGKLVAMEVSQVRLYYTETEYFTYKPVKYESKEELDPITGYNTIEEKKRPFKIDEINLNVRKVKDMLNTGKEVKVRLSYTPFIKIEQTDAGQNETEYKLVYYNDIEEMEFIQ